jgi:hypothetical protein
VLLRYRLHRSLLTGLTLRFIPHIGRSASPAGIHKQSVRNCGRFVFLSLTIILSFVPETSAQRAEYYKPLLRLYGANITIRMKAVLDVSQCVCVNKDKKDVDIDYIFLIL